MRMFAGGDSGGDGDGDEGDAPDQDGAGAGGWRSEVKPGTWNPAHSYQQQFTIAPQSFIIIYAFIALLYHSHVTRHHCNTSEVYSSQLLARH